MTDTVPTSDDLFPADTPRFMFDAWAGCLSWAINEPDIIAAFKADTGSKYSPPKHVIDAMIDDATGHTSSVVVAFVAWFNANVWGPMDGEMTEVTP